MTEAGGEKVRSLCLPGTCRAIQAYGCWAGALARSVEIHFGQMVEEKRATEGELAVLHGQVSSANERVTELEASLKTAEEQAQLVKQLKIDLQATRDEVSTLKTVKKSAGGPSEEAERRDQEVED